MIHCPKGLAHGCHGYADPGSSTQQQGGLWTRGRESQGFSGHSACGGCPWPYCQVIMVCIYFLLVSSILRTVLCIESILKHLSPHFWTEFIGFVFGCRASRWCVNLASVRNFEPRQRASSEPPLNTLSEELCHMTGSRKQNSGFRKPNLRSKLCLMLA